MPTAAAMAVRPPRASEKSRSDAAPGDGSAPIVMASSSRYAAPGFDRRMARALLGGVGGRAGGRGGGRGSERVGELPKVALGNGIALEAVAGGPPVAGEMEGPEDEIDHRQVHGEILVHRFGLRAVVPVVELRGGEHPPHGAEAEI